VEVAHFAGARSAHLLSGKNTPPLNPAIQLFLLLHNTSLLSNMMHQLMHLNAGRASRLSTLQPPSRADHRQGMAGEAGRP